MQARKAKKVSFIVAALMVSVFILFDVFDLNAGKMEPTSAPAPTMHNLNEVYHNIAPAVPSDWSAMPSSAQTTGKGAIHMTIDGIQGSCQAEGREGTIVVVGLEHKLYLPLGSQGQPSGTRVHEPLSVVKYFDKSSPELYRHLCENRVINRVTLRFYRTSALGVEHYYTIELENARIFGIRQYFPNMEYVSLSYERIGWKNETDGIEYQDVVPGAGGGGA